MTRALITGGAGFIGSHLVDQLLSHGQRVTVIDDLSTGSLDNLHSARASDRFECVIESVRNREVVDRLVSEHDVVYHLASAVGVDLIISQPVAAIESCVLGSEVVLAAAARHGKKLLLTSSSEIYGKSTAVPFSETDDRLLGPTTTSRWSYSSAKAIDEFLALAYHRQHSLPVVIARLFNTIGPRQKSRYGMVVPRFVRAARRGEPIQVYGDGRQTRCFAYVGDVVRALVDLMQHPAANGEVYNVGNDQEISMLDLAERVRRIVGSSSEIVTVPYNEVYENGFEDMRRRVPDLRRVRGLIPCEPTLELDEIIRQIWEHEERLAQRNAPAAVSM